jgi:hypothetical protein
LEWRRKLKELHSQENVNNNDHFDDNKSGKDKE